MGRISVQFDSLQQEVQGDATGSFGMFESEHDDMVANALFATAIDWLRVTVATHVRGPFSLSINEERDLLAYRIAPDFPATPAMQRCVDGLRGRVMPRRAMPDASLIGRDQER